MRLAVFTSKYPARVATFFERDMRALIDAGIEIDVYAIYPLDAEMWKYRLDILDERRLPADRVHHLGLPSALRRAGPTVRSRPRALLRDTAAILPAAARFGAEPLAKTAYVLPKAWAWAAEAGDRYDHVLAYWGNYAGTCAYAFHRALGQPIPFSIWLHAGTDLYRKPVFLREKLLYADTIVTCCAFNRTFLQEQFADIYDAIASRIHVCYHGLELSQFPFTPDNRPQARVLGVGKLIGYKGFDYLLRATRLLRDRGVAIHVELVGDGEQRRDLERLAAELDIADAVTFRGWLQFDQVREAMRGATLLVHPSDGLGDGLPNVLREAMAVGTPVVASRVAGIPEALDDGRCGLLVPPKDTEALAVAIARLLADRMLRQRFVTRARERTEQLFDLGKNGAELAERLRMTTRPGGLRRPRYTRRRRDRAAAS